MRSLAPLALAIAACGTPEPDGLDVPFAPHAAVLRRVTQSQFDHAIRDLFGEDLYVPGNLEPDLRLNNLVSLGSTVAALSPRGVERIEDAAYDIAAQAVDADHRGAWVPCAPSGVRDDACAEDALGPLARRAWRRTLSPDDLAMLVAIAGDAADALGDFHEGLAFGVAAVVQSPLFLMRDEMGDASGALTGDELASRMAWLIWDGLPDAALLDAAAAGSLATEEGLDAELSRMLADPRAKRGLRAWVADLFQLERLDLLQKDITIFPHMSSELPGSAKEEIYRSFERVAFTPEADVRDLFTSRVTEVDRNLAALYDVRAPVLDGFGEVEIPESARRVGIFGQAAFLALQSHPTSTSATLRGKFIRETLLCTEIPDPPAGVNTAIPEATEDAPTRRERVNQHLEDPSCSSCHLAFDPIGLGFENFDGLGGFRTTENGAPIDASGDLDGMVYTDSVGLAEALREHPDVVPCLVRQVVRNAVGWDPEVDQRDELAFIAERFAANGHQLPDLWSRVVRSRTFRFAAPPEEETP
jgi:hypothetical protein